MKQQISDLTDKERDWVATQIDAALLLVEAYSPADAGEPFTIGALDRAYAAWSATQETDNQLVNATINCTGIAFGQFLVEGVGLKWVIATDQEGSDLAVYGLPGSGDVLVYPANFVAKRWNRRETNFLEEAYRRIAQQVQAIGCGNIAKPSAKPWWKFW
jgi:hypothetical protein